MTRYGGPDGERLRWLERAIELTRAWIREQRDESAVERAFSAPGDWDYDYAVDLDREADKAEETLRALEAERELILGLKAALERDTDAGKYRE